jgi:hypothetical protein
LSWITTGVIEVAGLQHRLRTQRSSAFLGDTILNQQFLQPTVGSGGVTMPPSMPRTSRWDRFIAWLVGALTNLFG